MIKETEYVFWGNSSFSWLPNYYILKDVNIKYIFEIINKDWFKLHITVGDICKLEFGQSSPTTRRHLHCQLYYPLSEALPPNFHSNLCIEMEKYSVYVTICLFEVWIMSFYIHCLLSKLQCKILIAHHQKACHTYLDNK